ncbi:hypothetical protein ABIE65_000691 [Constrictibacter sp. MBR-5]|jgi:hypothetical protein|uniref:portal protein n=1 Tax=Constrictibacter sp. MBR-5 TaxID=3156467 RepID=UPI003398BE9A
MASEPDSDTTRADALIRRFAAARDRRCQWESHWRDCFEQVMPHRTRLEGPGAKSADRLFDGTAPDAVEQLAASLVAELTPPWSRWFGLAPGPDLTPEEAAAVAAPLDRAAETLQRHFDRSNFATEMQQAYLDLVTAGTASLLFEEAQPGEQSAFRFTAVPIEDVVLEEGPSGALDRTFRRAELTAAQIRARFPSADLPDPEEGDAADARHALLETVEPEKGGYLWSAVLEASADGEARLLGEGRFTASPFLNFRWLKAPGEVYGRSPVMKALPDIKTANKVVELILKNASIAVTGIWQADDDGVLNPATVRLVPGAIIPKAQGSAGLTPLAAPGRFDVSQLVLDDLRARIRHALLVDRLGPVDAPRMTATEVLQRSAEMARVLGATYGRLQSELLSPLVTRGLALLRRRGEVPDIVIDGRTVTLEYRSPLAMIQAEAEVRATLMWLEATATLGPDAASVVDGAATARWIGRRLGVPAELMRETGSPAEAAPGAAVQLPAELLAGMADVLG